MFMNATLWIKFPVFKMMELFVILLDLKLGAILIIRANNFVQLKMDCLVTILLLVGTLLMMDIMQVLLIKTKMDLIVIPKMD
jgi:hypothetical protein